jgi:hypothetical protein
MEKNVAIVFVILLGKEKEHFLKDWSEIKEIGGAAVVRFGGARQISIQNM